MTWLALMLSVMERELCSVGVVFKGAFLKLSNASDQASHFGKL